ncbi:hypothetical protein LPJ66_010591 [Kickxella alabastrina]|uniref:Uncharacterized protein n=1 Tax=Kickxella alabastrina TaxID=61397 RepID=A0ACC1I094_9FUNG|nr:hypothetical protein LPJ66_010591 [Kickxella alabastrina]
MPIFRRLTTRIKRVLSKFKKRDTTSSPNESAPVKFQEYAIRLKDDVSAEQKQALEQALDERIKAADGVFKWSELIGAFLINIPITRPGGEANETAKLIADLETEFKDAIEYIEELGRVRTQAPTTS